MKRLLAAALVATTVTPALADSHDAAWAIAGMYVATQVCGLEIPNAAVQEVILTAGIPRDQLSAEAAFATRLLIDRMSADGGAALKFCSEMGKAVGEASR